MPIKVKPLGVIKPGPSAEDIWFCDADENRDARISSFWNPKTVGIGDITGVVFFDRSQVESLVAHLEAWLETGSFEIKETP